MQCTVKDCSSGQMEEFSSEFFKRARKMGRESITGRLAKSMKVNSKMTSAKVRVHFTTQMVKISWGYGKRVRSTERVTTSGRAKRSDEDEGRIVDVPFWFCDPPIVNGSSIILDKSTFSPTHAE